MAFLSIPNVRVKGISACIPHTIDDNRVNPLIPDPERDKLLSTIGVEQKPIVEAGVTSSDLCLAAAERLIDELKWHKEDIEGLIFVSQTPDYILPATSCILQERLGLSKECHTLDISLGCSGWSHGMITAASLVSNGLKKVLLLCGDTTSLTTSRRDKTAWPLFGDAGTCTALEGDKKAPMIFTHSASDGSGFKAIIIPSGGYRNPFKASDLEYVDRGDGKVQNNLHSNLDGMSVFSFAISQAPKSIKMLCECYGINIDEVDCFVFHQANYFLNEKVRKKLKLPAEKVPYSLKEYGNSSCATIPVTLVTQWRESLQSSRQRIIGCGFGVGLSWSSVYFETESIVVPELIVI